MGDNYFDGTLDDFYDGSFVCLKVLLVVFVCRFVTAKINVSLLDSSFWDLARSALALSSPPPPCRAPAPQAQSSPGRPPLGVDTQPQGGSRACPPALGGGLQQNGPFFDVFSGGFAAGPTHAASHRPPQAASWRPEPIRLSASWGNPETHALQRNASVHHNGSFTTTSTPRHPTFSSALPAHGISSLRQNSGGSSFPNRAFPHLNQHRNIHLPWTNRNQANQDLNPPSVAGSTDQLTAPRAIATANSHSPNTTIPAMSSNPRRGGAHSADRSAGMAGPSTPAQPTQSSGSTTRTPRRSASRGRQAGPSKRKRESDLDDLFGDGDLPDNPVLDLVDKEEIPAEILKAQEEKKNYVKLSTFDCVICMDNAKVLTVTHCGRPTRTTILFSL